MITMFASIVSLFLAGAYQPASFTSSRVLADVNVYITSSRVTDPIFIGECRGFESGPRVMVRLVESRAEADIAGYLVDDPDRADHVFCTS